jgi:hypothetical protein
MPRSSRSHQRNRASSCNLRSNLDHGWTVVRSSTSHSLGKEGAPRLH